MRILRLAAIFVCLGVMAGDRASSKCAADADRLDTMIGQMIMVGFLGDDERDEGVIAVREHLAKGIVGGVVLFPENIVSPRQLRHLTAYLRNARSNPVPFIAVDQEGGKVQRLSRRNGHRGFPSARSVGRLADAPESAARIYAKMAAELAHAGFNLNFGPVVDLNRNPSNPVIGRLKRSYGEDPETVTAIARGFIEAHRAANVVTVAKHFPGHGSSRADSHKTLADVSGTWREVELEPYRILAEEGLLDAVMIGHLYHPRFSDKDKLPASLSAESVRALRNEHWLDYQGVVISDDMEMGAVRHDYLVEERIVMAINGGIDIVVFSNVKTRDVDLGPKIHAIISKAVADGRIDRLRIEKAYGKIMLLKRRLMQKDLVGKW